ncbi:MAG: carbon-nitrogen hydrolase family protein [Rubricella sp.]
MKVALLQFTGSDDPAANRAMLGPMLENAATGGANLIATPEVTNCISASRTVQAATLRAEEEDETLAFLREQAARLGVTILAGSLALTGGAGGRFVNRSFLIEPDGGIAARYDKAHMFDVDVDPQNSFRESAGYAPGSRAVVADAAGARIGLTICYDMRFPGLYQRLARGGAQIITVPSAFTVPTGKAHWEVLLRARAIETGCFILAPAQVGSHPAREGRKRQSWGHSLIVSPWGVVLADAGDAPGTVTADLDPSECQRARARIPSLLHETELSGP